MPTWVNNSKSASPSWTNQSKSTAPTWTNQQKSNRLFGTFTIEEQSSLIGNLSNEDPLPGTNPPINVGDANLETPIFTQWQNQTKSP